MMLMKCIQYSRILFELRIKRHNDSKLVRFQYRLRGYFEINASSQTPSRNIDSVFARIVQLDEGEVGSMKLATGMR